MGSRVQRGADGTSVRDGSLMAWTLKVSKSGWRAVRT